MNIKSTMRRRLPITLMFFGLVSTNTLAMNNQQLEDIILQRLSDDRTRACFAVAFIDKSEVHQAFACADPTTKPRIDAQSAFEIGSISKTMMGTLLAGLIMQGKASLNDPLQQYLPTDARVPDFDGQPIRLRHIVTHTSGLPGLPPGIGELVPEDPYANIDQEKLISALAQTTIEHAPGSQYVYSNYATMLLSWAISRRAETDFATLASEQIFKPLDMQGAFVMNPSSQVHRAQGHIQSGSETPPWTFQPELAGLGGVSATLDDMTRYARAQLGTSTTDRTSALTEAIALSHQPVAMPTESSDSADMRKTDPASDTSSTNIASDAGDAGDAGDAASTSPMFWSSFPLNDTMLLAHGGGTGGFSSFLVFDKGNSRAVVVLSDTAFSSIGGVSNLALHLLDDSIQLDKPRKTAIAPDDLLDELKGRYRMDTGMEIELSNDEQTLTAQATGQSEFKMSFDSNGDFYPLEFDALLVPLRRANGSMSFVWHQGGAVIPAKRIDEEIGSQGFAPGPAQLQAYTGDYPLKPEFILTIQERDGVLTAQATGQGEFPLTPAGSDIFDALQFGIEIVFERDETEQVNGLTLLQNGKETQAKKR